MPQGTWQQFRLPGKKASLFSAVKLDGHDALLVESDTAASMLRYKVRVEPADLRQIRFSWKVPQLIAGADMAVRDTEDSPARLVLAFDGDRSRLPGRFQMMSELARALTGEEMPYATLMYVWANEARVGSVIMNPRTDRIRKIVVASGSGQLNQWMQFDRNIRADYEEAYGEAPGALIGVGLMTDTDNTATSAHSWYGPIQLSR